MLSSADPAIQIWDFAYLDCAAQTQNDTKIRCRVCKRAQPQLQKGMLANKKWKADFILQTNSSNSIIYYSCLLHDRSDFQWCTSLKEELWHKWRRCTFLLSTPVHLIWPWAIICKHFHIQTKLMQRNIKLCVLHHTKDYFLFDMYGCTWEFIHAGVAVNVLHFCSACARKKPNTTE